MSRQVPQTVSFINNGISFDVNKVQTAFSNQGVSAPPKCRMDIIPAATTDNFICPVNAFNAAGQPLTAANQVTFLNKLVVQLDCDRCPRVLFSAISTAATTITITGYDYRNVKVTATSPNLIIGTIAWNCPKAMSKILSVVLTASPGAGITIQVGNGQAIGLPYFITSAQQITSLSFNGAPLDPLQLLDAPADRENKPTSVAVPAGLVFGPGNPWRVGATQVPAVPPTSVTADARGIIAILDPVADPAFDDVKMISIEFYVYGADSYVQCQLMNNVVSAQTMVGGIIGVPNPIPTLVYADEVGWQFPGDGGYNG